MPENAKGWGDQMIAYLPMTKSAVRGLDTIQDQGGSRPIPPM